MAKHLRKLRLVGVESLQARRWLLESSSDLGDTGKLPERRVGGSIPITTRSGETWTATVVEVLQRRAGDVLVREAGKP